MKKLLLLIATVSLLLIGCTSSEVPEDLPEDVEITDDAISADIDGDGITDIEVSTTEEVIETEVDIQEVGEFEDFCVPGSTYAYAGDSGSVDSIVIGLTTYKGSEFCQAESSTVIESPAGQMTAETTYYFDSAYNEFWIVTTVDSEMMPSPQTTEIHLIDGQIQS